MKAWMYPDHPGLHNRDSSPFDRKQTFMLRVRQNMCGLVFGLLILGFTTWLIVWNEGRAVGQAKMLDDGLSLVVPVGNSQVKAENEGKLIHTTGTVEVGDFYEDKLHGVRIRAARVRRVVEMYQWHEMEDHFRYGDREDEEDDDDDEMAMKRRYRRNRRRRRRGIHDFGGPMRHPDYDRYEPEFMYMKEWHNDLVRSDQFTEEEAHKNPDSFPFASEDFTSNSVTLGHFHVSRDLLDKMKEFIKYSPTSAPTGSKIKVELGYFYHASGGSSSPKIGDIRVSYQYAGLSGQTTISVVGQQYQGSIIGYPMETGDTLHVLHHGGHSAETMFEKEIDASHILTWTLRTTGWLGVFVGFSCFMGIVSTILEWIPIVRDMIVVGGSVMKLSVSTSYLLLIIALKWVWIRPLLGLVLLGAAAVPFILARRRTRHHRVL